jgi:hypothetical protein
MWPLRHPMTVALVWCGLLLAISIPLATRRFRIRTTQ